MSKAIERIVPHTKEWEAYYANHIFRYDFAERQIKHPIRILDAACGVGYGTCFLADKFGVETIGVDVSESALAVAENQFKTDKTVFIRDDCESLKKITGIFSHAVSYETFEHLENPDSFLTRAYELLDVNGALILSTPNADVTSPDRKVEWAFHEKEYRASELVELVQTAGFKNIRLFGQTYSSLGLLRNEMRKELNRLHHNPWIRLGKWMQRKTRGIDSSYVVLPEQVEDFEMIKFADPQECEKMLSEGPFVLIAVAQK
jgi:ubiquinone/menaquinone biosynthesis C-methylase UbiE